jgi:hypothetical protein
MADFETIALNNVERGSKMDRSAENPAKKS